MSRNCEQKTRERQKLLRNLSVTMEKYVTISGFNNVNVSIHLCSNLQTAQSQKLPWLGCGLSLSKLIVQCNDTESGRAFKSWGLLRDGWGREPLWRNHASLVKFPRAACYKWASPGPLHFLIILTHSLWPSLFVSNPMNPPHNFMYHVVI